jgi:hypothetical protein
MSIGRKIARNQARKAMAGVPNLAALGDAVKALSNLDKVKQLNDLLGLVQEIMPRLVEVQQACAGLIQEKADLERKVHRDSAAILGVIAHVAKLQPEAVQELYEEIAASWDAENPLPDVGAMVEPPAPALSAGETTTSA